MIRKYCVQKDTMGCNFYVYYKGEHNGGGPLFIKYIFGTDEFLEEHKDCKSVLELCSGPGFIGWYLYKNLKMDSAHFLDIHKPVGDDLKITSEENNEELNFYHSDGFKNYNGPKVDLIVMNPPFFYTEEQFEHHKKHMGLTDEEKIKTSKRIILDLDFKLHQNMIENFEKHLTDNGRIVFLEDLRFIPKEMITSKIEREPKYKEYYVAPEFFDEKGEMVRMENSENIPEDVPNYYTLTYYKKAA